ncbi:hypothetical protein [uncultured Cellulomonas sp.]|uniref:glycosyltransferase family protein n=1 Tax=uncultured Cellulomonas sp. TaxID=189682 RepID=UPI0028E70053|nr:hypothetical protein [uncultured Cellulomonas sp.]
MTAPPDGSTDDVKLGVLRRYAGSEPGGRSVLLVAPSFFGYESTIARALAHHSEVVFHLDERASNSALVRATYRIRPGLLAAVTRRHFRRALAALSERTVDVVVVIKGEVTPAWFLRDVRRSNPDVRVVFYAYDPIAADDNYFALRPHVDRAYSFDAQDVARLPELAYKPLFYGPAFSAGPSHAERRWDLASVGTVNPERYEKTEAAAAAVDTSFRHMYTPSAALLAVKRLIDPEFGTIDPSRVTGVKLSQHEVAEVFRQSRVVLDVQKAGQSGLTMRTLEAIASGASIVTWNEAVKNEDFYDPDRIAVVDPDGGGVQEAILRVLMRPLDGSAPSGFERHSVSAWVSEFLDSTTAPVSAEPRQSSDHEEN